MMIVLSEQSRQAVEDNDVNIVATSIQRFRAARDDWAGQVRSRLWHGGPARRIPSRSVRPGDHGCRLTRFFKESERFLSLAVLLRKQHSSNVSDFSFERVVATQRIASVQTIGRSRPIV